ncbi:hypothetical protein Dimus_037612, partial [Dionaea muscipula]
MLCGHRPQSGVACLGLTPDDDFIGEAEPRGQQPLVASSASLSGQLQGSFMQRAASKLRAHHPTAGSTAMGIIASSCDDADNLTYVTARLEADGYSSY